MIDWITILDAHNIDYVTTGPSTSKGNAYVKCPLCGAGDEGFHLGISLADPWRGWGCWRNQAHRGRNPAKLLAALLGKPYADAQRILGRAGGLARASDGDLLDKLKGLLEPQAEDEEDHSISMPDSFRTIRDKGTGVRFVDYLEKKRGYRRDEIEDLAKTYKLKYTTDGLFKYRVIFPIYGETGLLTWTGRALSNDMEPRYLTLSTDPEKAEKWQLPVARTAINNCLFNERELFQTEAELLTVCEGPTDAMWWDWIGRPHARATALFGKVIHDEQVDKLRDLAPNFKRRILVLDEDASLDALATGSPIQHFGFRRHILTNKDEDPAKMSRRAVKKLLSNWTGRTF